MVNQFAGQNKGSKSLRGWGWGWGVDQGPIAQNLCNVIYNCAYYSTTILSAPSVMKSYSKILL